MRNTARLYLQLAKHHLLLLRRARTFALTVQEIAAVKDDAEKDLAAAKPALDAALSALNSITPKDITALKALKNPPDIVKRIFDCVLILRCGFLCAMSAQGNAMQW